MILVWLFKIESPFRSGKSNPLGTSALIQTAARACYKTPSSDMMLEGVTGRTQDHAVFAPARGQQLHPGSEAAVATGISLWEQPCSMLLAAGTVAGKPGSALLEFLRTTQYHLINSFSA